MRVNLTIYLGDAQGTKIVLDMNIESIAKVSSDVNQVIRDNGTLSAGNQTISGRWITRYTVEEIRS